jgi:DNA polymerase III subunit alpha
MYEAPDFIHLHNHTDYSLLDGAASIKKMVAKAKTLGMRHLAITDHGNMFGALHFYRECIKNDINPIVGCEFYVAPGNRNIKAGNEKGSRSNHLILLAKNYQGYKNLMILASKAYTEGFYYKPRIDDELLEKYGSDLICTSSCLAGYIPRKLLDNQQEDAKNKALYYQDLFGKGNYYLELQDHGIPEQKIVNEKMINLSRETGIPLVATNDMHYLDREDANAQDILICIGTNKKKHEVNRMKFSSSEFYMKTKEEMYETFKDIPEALNNTYKIAESCTLKISLPGPLLPEYSIPEKYDNPDDYLRAITHEGVAKRYPEITEEIRKRTEFELDTIINMGFTGYFLIVWDFIHYARENDIPVGPGRGSGAGSIVAFGLMITDIDPLKYGLIFERFLNPDRVSMPDFDIDFCFERRQEVIDYVTRKYGKDRVGQIITFGTLKAKAVIRDVARVLDFPYAEADQISKMIPAELKMTIEKAIEIEPKLKEVEERGDRFKELIDTGKRLEGLSRHASTHAAGVVIGRSQLTDYVPLYRDSKTGSISTQYTMDLLEDCGLVKMDFLGLKTLTLIKNTETLIKRQDPDFLTDNIPEEDSVTFKLLGEGKSVCVFQFESSGMQGILRQAKPDSIEDLIALNALYRPGPMQYIPQFVDSKNGRKSIIYPDPSLKATLQPTYGVIVYQEQVMEVARIIGGFSLGKADILRRAMGKKKVKEMDRMKIEFLDGAVQKGFTKKKAEDIFEMLVPFAGYGFNKSHAAAYSVIAYKTAWLKANYPAEFMAANLTNEINNPDKMTLYINETKSMGLKILPPNINLSYKNFAVANGDIIYGLVGVKNVGAAAVEEIIRAREENGEYTSYIDFLEKVDLKSINRKVMESLIYCGAFDPFSENRATLIQNLEKSLDFVTKLKAQSMFGQVSLFDSSDETALPTFDMESIQEFPVLEMLNNEKELLGYYFSGHPMDKYKQIWQKSVTLNLNHTDEAMPDRKYTILGTITSARVITTKRGKQMAFLQIEDFKGSLELIIFPKIWENKSIYLNTDSIMGFEGKIDTSRGDPKFLVDDVLRPEEMKESGSSEVHIKMGSNFNEDDLISLRSFLIDNQGNSSVYLHMISDRNENDTIIKVSGQITMGASENVLKEMGTYPNIEEVWVS